MPRKKKDPKLKVCAWPPCKLPVKRKGKMGPHPKYCGHSHRQQAYAARRTLTGVKLDADLMSKAKEAASKQKIGLDRLIERSLKAYLK